MEEVGMFLNVLVTARGEAAVLLVVIVERLWSGLAVSGVY